jgi:short-subunit dehydrogenase
MGAGMFAVVTGASSGIGHELARICAVQGWSLLICAEDDAIETAATELRGLGATVEAVRADLATREGVEALLAAVGGRQVDALMANAGAGLGGAFLDRDIDGAMKVVDLNVGHTLRLIHALGRAMRARGAGRILVTGSIAGFVPGPFHATYNASKSFLDNFCYALRNELKDSGVTVTCLMPGVTDTEFFERAGLESSPMGETSLKADPADVARDGFDAMMRGEAGVVSGFMNKVQSMFSGIIPPTVLAEMHRRLVKPDGA